MSLRRPQYVEEPSSIFLVRRETKRRKRRVAEWTGGGRVATRSFDGTVRLWDTVPGADASREFEVGAVGPAGVLFAASGQHFTVGLPNSVAFTPSGRHFAVALSNGTIALFATPPAAAR